MIFDLFRKRKRISIQPGRCSSEKCPTCGHWSSKDEPHDWQDEGDYVEVMTCPSDHKSRWIMGPGIMINID
jgi:hypothetical protein